jgi:lysozyme family protein
MTDDDIINLILKYEGGYTNNPNDHGGPTNFGITAADYGRWLRQTTAATPDQVRTMDVVTARQIYTQWYIKAPGFDQVADMNLRLVLADSGVLFGVKRSTIWLQSEVGAAADGTLGADTLRALAGYSAPNLLARRVLGRRFAAIADIVKSNATQVTFLRGWISRAVSLLDYV